MSIARSNATSMEGDSTRSRVMTWAMTSVSLVVWKMQPVSSSFSRSSAALVRLPLWATDMVPLMWLMTRGWALARERVPVVA